MKLADLHFCKDDKVKYRKHLTIGVGLATALGFIGTAHGIVWMQNVAAAVNAITAIIWIWE